jgi:hypothetical protein
MPGRIAVVEPDPIPSISGITIPFDAIGCSHQHKMQNSKQYCTSCELATKISSRLSDCN